MILQVLQPGESQCGGAIWRRLNHPTIHDGKIHGPCFVSELRGQIYWGKFKSKGPKSFKIIKTAWVLLPNATPSPGNPGHQVLSRHYFTTIIPSSDLIKISSNENNIFQSDFGRKEVNTTTSTTQIFLPNLWKTPITTTTIPSLRVICIKEEEALLNYKTTIESWVFVHA